MSTATFHRLRRTAAIAFLAAAGSVGFAVAAGAQVGPQSLPTTPTSVENNLTSEGDTITNRAWVSYTDANGNSYAPQMDSVFVVVGFKPGIDVEATFETQSPASGSTNNELPFALCNTGNGTDQFQVDSLVVSDTAVFNIRYKWNGTTYATRELLNAALDDADVNQGDCIEVIVIYDVKPVPGGTTIDVTLHGSSYRDPTEMDDDTSALTTMQSGDIMVTPDNEPVTQLPSNGTNYTATFWVYNNQTGMDDFSLEATSSDETVVVIYSVDGVTGYTGSINALAAGDSMLVSVVYTVLNVNAGSTAQITLKATSDYDNTVYDTGDYDLTVIRPALTIDKQVFDSLGVAQIDTVIPGQQIWYKITISNTGTAPADTVVITDSLPSELTYLSSAQDGPTWTITEPSTSVIRAQLDGSLPNRTNVSDPYPSRYIWIKVRVK